MAGWSAGYQAAQVKRQLTPGPISSLPGTAGLPPFISFSTSYPELNSAVLRHTDNERLVGKRETPEIGEAAFTWAQTVFGVTCAASKEMNTMRDRGCIIKTFFQPPVMWTLVGCNTFSRVIANSP
jgi:hypothetical protein